MEQNETLEETSTSEKQLAALPYLVAAPSIACLYQPDERWGVPRCHRGRESESLP